MVNFFANNKGIVTLKQNTAFGCDGGGGGV